MLDLRTGNDATRGLRYARLERAIGDLDRVSAWLTICILGGLSAAVGSPSHSEPPVPPVIRKA